MAEDVPDPPRESSRAGAALEPLRFPSFTLYATARACSVTATTMFQASVAWQVYAISGSAFDLGMLGLVRFFPHAALSLVGGVMADSYDRRRLLIAAQSVPMLCGAILAIATYTGAVSIPLIYGLVLAIALASAFEYPAGASLLPTLVPRSVFPKAVVISTSLTSLARVTGPAAGGLVIASSGVAATYVGQAGLLAGSLLAIVFVRSRVAPSDSGVSLQAVREGIAYVRRKHEVLGAMTLDMFAVIFAGATALLPVYANEILEVGPRGYGLLASALEIGALVTAVAMVVLPPMERVGRTLILAVAVYGLATILFGISRSFPLSVAAYMLVGMADQVSVVARHTLIQLSTPDELRGRVSSVNMVFIGASNQLGAVEAGFVASLTSATFAVVTGGIGCLLVLGAVAWWLPELRNHRIDPHAPDIG